MATSTTNRKLGKLYEGLSERERVRMMAKLAREHKPDEMNRLRDATPPEHAETYNRALKLLRVLNGNLTDWLTIFRIGMERDRFRVQSFAREAAHKWLQNYRMGEIWKLVAYPVTESEYRAMVKRQRAEPYELDSYAEHLSELEGDEEGLRPEIAEFLQHLPPELELRRFDHDEWTAWRASSDYEQESQEQDRRSEEITRRLRGIIDAAIERGELPKPKQRDGEPYLPWGVLQDWGEGTTLETYEPFGPEYFVPALELFGADFAKWDVRPDSEAEAVKQRRREMLDVFISLAGIPPDERGAIESLEPPKTAAALNRARKQAEKLHDTLYEHSALAELTLEAATVHATHRAQLEGLSEAIAIIQRDDFHGEDPLWPEVRLLLEAAQEEAERFHDAWDSVSTGTALRAGLRSLQGLEPYPDDNISEPAPLPTLEPDTEDMLTLIRGWGE